VEISAKTGQGIDVLLGKIEEMLSRDKKKVTLRLPYDKARLVETLHREGAVTETKYLEECIEIDAVISQGLYWKFREYVTGRQ